VMNGGVIVHEGPAGALRDDPRLRARLVGA